ncbi:MAG TPA: DUF5615 family PIN-like protein [Candidatus Saccharimonadales bacterium]|nr:DUF5615 family PIN-like protein [Candidatus Saccharimonadales bacterium]
MLRLLIDENFDHRILRGLKSRLPELDYVLVRQIGLFGSPDPALLRWAAQNDRTIVTRDISTMPHFAATLLRRGEAMAGIIVVPETMPIGRAIDGLELMVACHSREELQDRTMYLPL